MTFGKGGNVAIDPLPMIQRLSMSLVMTINWGVRIPSIDDPLFKEIVAVEEELNRTRSTVGNAQDHIPLLRLNPFNSTSVKARAMRNRRDEYLAQLSGDLAKKMEEDTNKPCIQASVIRFKEVELNETELTAISLSVLGGGFETVSNTMQWSIAFLAQHLDIQDRAYEEICKFQGSDEPLCDASDDQKCGYILGLAKEALRYFSVIPLALPRETIKDIEYEGVRIPAGSTVYMNAWACNHGESLSHNPHVLFYKVSKRVLMFHSQILSYFPIRIGSCPRDGPPDPTRRSLHLVSAIGCVRATSWRCESYISSSCVYWLVSASKPLRR